MTPARYAEIIRSLDSTLRKIFDAVPTTQAWNVHEIRGELNRVGKRLEMGMIVGCLNSLKKDGLIKEPDPGHFRRAMEPTPPAQESEVTKPSKPADPLDELTQLSQDLFEMSDKIENIVKAIRAKPAEVEQQGEKFKQLQALLKGLA